MGLVIGGDFNTDEIIEFIRNNKYLREKKKQEPEVIAPTPPAPVEEKVYQPQHLSSVIDIGTAQKSHHSFCKNFFPPTNVTPFEPSSQAKMQKNSKE